jgi:hypothetical protein
MLRLASDIVLRLATHGDEWDVIVANVVGEELLLVVRSV